MPKRTSTIASITGSIIEWYDFVLFAYLTPVFSRVFFSGIPYKDGVFFSLLIFAAGNIMRPLGAAIFGHMGDRVGRAKTLQTVLLLMSFSNFIMASLPSSHHIGVSAVVLLVITRLFQGMCIGGEFSGSMVYLAEHCRPTRRAFITSMINTGSNVGIVLALILITSLNHAFSHEGFVMYGWRLCYVIGGCFGLFGLFRRLQMQDSELFTKAAKELSRDMLPIVAIFKLQAKPMLIIGIQLTLSAAGSYVLTMFFSTYMHVYLKLSYASSLNMQTVFVVISLALIPAFSWLSDHIGRRSVLSITAVGYLVLGIPCFYLFTATLNPWSILPLIILFCAEQGTTPATITENYPLHNRYTGVAVSYNLVMSLVGGCTPVINAWLIHITNDLLIPGYYLAAFGFIVLLNILFGIKRQYGDQVNLLR